MNYSKCQNCGAHPIIGQVICSYCEQPYSPEAMRTAIPCPNCRTYSTADQRQCINCNTPIVVQCIFCGAHSPHTMHACSTCNEIFLGAAERKAQLEDQTESEDEYVDEDGWEEGWAWCQKCQVMVSDEDVPGSCAASGKHDTSDSEYYYLCADDETYEAEPGWRWCRRCYCLFFIKAKGNVCVVTRAAHDGSDSYDYRLSRDSDDDYDEDAGGWNCCQKCAVLFWGESKGPCAAGGKHESGKSPDYAIPYED